MKSSRYSLEPEKPVDWRAKVAEPVAIPDTVIFRLLDCMNAMQDKMDVIKEEMHVLRREQDHLTSRMIDMQRAMHSATTMTKPIFSTDEIMAKPKLEPEAGYEWITEDLSTGMKTLMEGEKD